MKTILFVEDEVDHIVLLQTRLEAAGYEFLSATDGEEGLKIALDKKPDLILLDIVMPKMNGYEVLEQVKSDPALRHIPVIVISAVDNLDSVIKCIEMGAEDYLFKPFNNIIGDITIPNPIIPIDIRIEPIVYIIQDGIVISSKLVLRGFSICFDSSFSFFISLIIFSYSCFTLFTSATLSIFELCRAVFAAIATLPKRQKPIDRLLKA